MNSGEFLLGKLTPFLLVEATVFALLFALHAYVLKDFDLAGAVTSGAHSLAWMLLSLLVISQLAMLVLAHAIGLSWSAPLVLASTFISLVLACWFYFGDAAAAVHLFAVSRSALGEGLALVFSAVFAYGAVGLVVWEEVAD